MIVLRCTKKTRWINTQTAVSLLLRLKTWTAATQRCRESEHGQEAERDYRVWLLPRTGIAPQRAQTCWCELCYVMFRATTGSKCRQSCTILMTNQASYEKTKSKGHTWTPKSQSGTGEGNRTITRGAKEGKHKDTQQARKIHTRAFTKCNRKQKLQNKND